MTERDHHYRASLVWDGNLGAGTADYERYGRQYRVLFEGKPALAVSADAAFRGDAARLHDKAHELCFIARACNFPVRHPAEVKS